MISKEEVHGRIYEIGITLFDVAKELGYIAVAYNKPDNLDFNAGILTVLTDLRSCINVLHTKVIHQGLQIDLCNLTPKGERK